MKLLKSLSVGVFIWLAIGIAVAARISWQSGTSNYLDIFSQSLPSWFIWAFATPLIFLISKKLPIAGDKLAASITLQLLFGVAFILLYSAVFSLVDTTINGSILKSDSLMETIKTNAAQHYQFIAILWGLTTAVAYTVIYIRDRPQPLAQKKFENTILIKTKFGFVLVEIEHFQYTKGGTKKIMFHTGDTKHLDRNRVEQSKGALVEEHRYMPERQIVIDLSKIRRADHVAINKYIFYIGYSHELTFNEQIYQALGGWLPRPRKTFED
jgi:hypothetical protein